MNAFSFYEKQTLLKLNLANGFLSSSYSSPSWFGRRKWPANIADVNLEQISDSLFLNMLFPPLFNLHLYLHVFPSALIYSIG